MLPYFLFTAFISLSREMGVLIEFYMVESVEIRIISLMILIAVRCECIKYIGKTAAKSDK